MRKSLLFFIGVGGLLLATPSNARDIVTLAQLTTFQTCNQDMELHLTDATEPIKDQGKVNITSPDAWVIFDNLKPNEVVKRYSNVLQINGQPFNPQTNGRVAIYKQGAAVMAHSAHFAPLTVYTATGCTGDSASCTFGRYYTNCPPENAPKSLVLPLTLDNRIHSFVLKRGYSVTLANEPNGMGYSRVFIADQADICLTEMPELLDGKVSFIRVSKWQYASKKGWAGSVWSSAPEGLKYVTEQSDFTNSTWYYNWGCTTTKTSNPNTTTPNYNQEFVPEKWGAGGSWNSAYSITDVAQLMGYNEPDHTEQSNVSVEKAIEEWPLMMQTGLRLGSPATTNFTWLNEFMKEIKHHNYRVDYVVIHAYWGGMSGQEWYEQLKKVHESTGRPLWIKEWNNGANWTHESWPSGTAAQQAKQLNDLRNILTVMDTAHFVERYSIYNWVEDKRAIILNGKLTPAGEYYATDAPDFGYLPQCEVVPTWSIREAPVLTYHNYSVQQGIELEWSDANGELIDHYRLEYSTDGLTFESIDTVKTPICRYQHQPKIGNLPQCYYRLQSTAYNGTNKTSNVVQVNWLNSQTLPVAQELLINENWAPALFSHSCVNPVLVMGVPTYRNKMPLALRARNLSANAFDYKLGTWEYQEKPTLVNPDTLATLILSQGVYQWGNIRVIADTMGGVTNEWQTVSFKQPFQTVPIVLPTQITDHKSFSSSVRIRQVTAQGFQIKIHYEGGVQTGSVSETISFLALTPGTTQLGDWTLTVGRTAEATVGSNATGGHCIHLENEATAMPLFYAAMQSMNDTIAATLRIKTRDKQSVTLIKDREKSTGHEDVQPETVGWLTLSKTVDTRLNSIVQPTDVVYDSLRRRASFQNKQPIQQATVCNLSGTVLLRTTEAKYVDLSSLPAGIYVIQINQQLNMKVIKR